MTERIRVPQKEDLAAFGSEVRELRKARQMTLADLAKASGVSISHLSAIERGAVSPTLRKFTQISEALGVAEEWFFSFRQGSGPLERKYVVRQENRRNLNLLYGESVEKAGYSDALLSASIGSAFHMGISDYPPYTESVPETLYTTEGEHHCYVLEGELVLRLGDETVTVRAGDSFSYPGKILHNTRNKSDKPARLIWVVSPVIIPKFVAVTEEDEASPPLETQEQNTGT